MINEQVVVVYGSLVIINETQSKVNVKVNEVFVLIGMWMKLKKVYEEMKTEKMTLTKWGCENAHWIGN